MSNEEIRKQRARDLFAALSSVNEAVDTCYECGLAVEFDGVTASRIGDRYERPLLNAKVFRRYDYASE